jgi:hypothetical protein
MMKKQCLLAVLCLGAVLLQGCGDQVSVKGTVTFPDGSPLTTGRVQFLTPTFVADGIIQPDGTYTIGSKKEGDGLPKGTYAVTVMAYAETNYAIDMRMDENVKPAESLIDVKYNSQTTSGLTCDVQGATVFDITVEPFKK